MRSLILQTSLLAPLVAPCQEVQALNLPRSGWKSFYHENAERLFKLEKAWAFEAGK